MLATGFGGEQDGQLERLSTDADALLMRDDRVGGGGGGDVDHGVGSLTLIEYTMATNQPVLVQFADCPRVDQKFIMK